MNHGSGVKLGFIGLGAHMCENLLPAFSSQGVCITAVSSRNPTVLDRVAKKYQALKRASDWRSLLDAKNLDGLVVAATPEVHELVLGNAMPAGIAVFAEKPPAVSTQSLTALSEVERRSSATVFIGFNFRFTEGFRLFRDFILTGGAPPIVRLRFLSSKPIEPWLGFDSVLESLMYGVAIHAVDLAIDLCDCQTVLSVSYVRITGSLLSLNVVLQGSSGSVVHLELGNYQNRFETAYRAVTKSGTVVDLIDNTRLEVSERGRSHHGRLKTRILSDISWARGGGDRAGYAAEAESFINSIQLNNTSPSSLTHCLRVYNIIDQILKTVSHPSNGKA